MGDLEWRTAEAMVKDIKQLDFDTKKDSASIFQLKSRENAIKRTYQMEKPEEIL